MENLRIDKPCPMMLNRMPQKDGKFSCKSCQKEVIDFRGKTPQEIADSIAPDTCGIFDNSQLPGQQKMSFFRQGMFYALTVLSFLGFNVSPLNAAPSKVSRSGQTEMNVAQPGKDDDKKDKKKKKHRKKRKTEFKTIGCPSF